MKAAITEIILEPSLSGFIMTQNVGVEVKTEVLVGIGVGCKLSVPTARHIVWLDPPIHEYNQNFSSFLDGKTYTSLHLS